LDGKVAAVVGGDKKTTLNKNKEMRGKYRKWKM
jgi:hypothetical protein